MQTAPRPPPILAGGACLCGALGA